jgi:acyl-CoA thioester hydrolase
VDRKNIDLSKYKFHVDEKVKFHEVDRMDVCNNAVYLNYFEDARLEYSKMIVEKYNLGKHFDDFPFFIMAHNEIDYFTPARLDDELKVYTRVNFIGTASFWFEHVVYRTKDGEIIAVGKGVVVHIDTKTQRPEPMPEDVIIAIMDFEGENISRKK